MGKSGVFFLAMVVTLVGWKLVERLSTDSLALALGLAFGILGVIPVALLVLVASWRRNREREYRPESSHGPSRDSYSEMYGDSPRLPVPPPVIIITGVPYMRAGGSQNGANRSQGGRDGSQHPYVLPPNHDGPLPCLTSPHAGDLRGCDKPPWSY